MALFLAVQAFSVLALGPQVVSSTSGNITFQFSEVEQCEPVSITFVGNSKPHAIPMWLTLVPFSSTPVSIPVTNITSDLSSVDVTFVPFAAGTRFIASLDDANGDSVAEVSDILQVLPSPTGNVTCLPISDAATMNYFAVNTNTFSQCENFTLQYNTTVISHAPTVRLFDPQGPSLLLDLTSDDSKTGIATYLLSFDRTKEVVLVFDDGSGHKASSAIMTVSGDTSSPVDCLTSSAPTRISKSVVIGLSVGGGLVVLIAFCMLFFILRKRRRRRGADPFNQIFIEKEQLSDPSEKRSLPPPTPSKDDQVHLKNPHTKKNYTSGATMASWSQPIPVDQQVPSKASAAHDANDDAVSLNSLDIEEMLHMAVVNPNQSSRQTAEPVSLGPVIPSETPSSPLYLTSKPSRHHIHDPSYFPFSHPSMASAISLTSIVDPFANDAFSRHGQVSLILSPQNFAKAQVQSVLPTSPRHGFCIKRERSSEVSGVPEDVRLSSASILGVVEHKRY